MTDGWIEGWSNEKRGRGENMNVKRNGKGDGHDGMKQAECRRREWQSESVRVRYKLAVSANRQRGKEGGGRGRDVQAKQPVSSYNRAELNTAAVSGCQKQRKKKKTSLAVWRRVREQSK